MNSIKKLSVVIMGAAVFTVISDPADAIMLTFGGTPVSGQGEFSNVPGVTTIDFESGAPTSGFAIYSAPGPDPAVVTGNTGISRGQHEIPGSFHIGRCKRNHSSYQKIGFKAPSSVAGFSFYKV